MPPTIDVAVLPSEASALEADCYVVVDVLRATTTIATLFEGRLLSLLAASEIGFARDRAVREDRLLFGEVGGLPPADFDYGNSPLEAAAAPVGGRHAVLFTTNGTAALTAMPDGPTVLAGSLANATAVANAARRFDQVAVVCAGNGGGTVFSLEDFLAAGYIADLVASFATGARPGDAAKAAIELSRAGRLRIAESHHARYLASINLGEDVAFCARADTSTAVPGVLERGPGWALLRDLAKE